MGVLRPVRVRGFLINGENREEFLLTISKPEKTPGHDDYFCRIMCSHGICKEEKIHGIDKTQARDLSIEYIHLLLDGKQIVYKNGVKINLIKMTSGRKFE